MTSRASSVAGFPASLCAAATDCRRQPFRPDLRPNGKGPARRCALRGYHDYGIAASYAGDRAVPPAWRAREQPNPPTRRLARWEVVLRLHARYASRTGLVNDYRLSALAAPRVFRDRNGSLTPERPTRRPTSQHRASKPTRFALLAVISR